MAISKDKRDKIVSQALEELIFARRYKQGKVKNWQKNEDLYYGKKDAPLESRANVDLGRMQEFVHSLLSKIDNPLVFKFVKRKESQLKRVKRLNALRQVDQQSGDWDIKDIAGKKQAVIYGRAIYAYYADSYNGYCSHLDNVDVYDFLVDPAAGGLDLERARYMGRYGVVKDKKQLKDGLKEGLYIRSEVSNLLDGDGNAIELNQEETNKRNRALDTNITRTEKESGITTDKYKFWEWYTTYEGDRYYLLLNERGGTAIRVERLEDIFTPTKDFPLAAWPFWTWAAFVDLTEFWTPSYCDYVREIFMAQAVSVNQMLDNAEQINKPQKVVNVNAIDNLAELKYRRDGYIKVKGDIDVNKAVQVLTPPSIKTPIDVFELLEGIQEKTTGVNAGTEGAAKTDAKVGIYEGNQANAADRFGLLNKSYSFGYKRFAKLYEIGVRDNLTKKVAIDMIGSDGIETEEVTRRDIFHKNDQFGVNVEASDAEEQASHTDQTNKLQFLTNTFANPAYLPILNAKKAFEIEAKVAGLTEDDIKQLLDTSEYGNAEIISEAELDIESLLEGRPTKANKAANLAYKQRFVDYLIDHEDDMDHDQFMRLATYVQSLEPIIMTNVVREMQQKIAAQQAAMPPQAGAPSPQPQPGGGAPAAGLSTQPAPIDNGVPVPALGA
jgi:hypothetical protein